MLTVVARDQSMQLKVAWCCCWNLSACLKVSFFSCNDEDFSTNIYSSTGVMSQMQPYSTYTHMQFFFLLSRYGSTVAFFLGLNISPWSIVFGSLGPRQKVLSALLLATRLRYVTKINWPGRPRRKPSGIRQVQLHTRWVCSAQVSYNEMQSNWTLALLR